MNDFLKRLFMGYHPMFDSGDGEGNGGGDTPTVVKFGGVEISTEGMTEAQIEALGKAQGAYTSSSQEASRLAGELKKRETNPSKPNEEKPTFGSQEEIQKYINEQIQKGMSGFKDIENKGKIQLMNRSIEDFDRSLRSEYPMLNDEQFSAAVANAKKMFDAQPIEQRSLGMYKNIIAVEMGGTLKNNLSSIEDNALLGRIKNNPELLKQIAENFGKELGINANMPIGGYANEEQFITKMDSIRKQLDTEKNPQKRSELFKELSDEMDRGKAYGYSYKI